MNCWLFVFDSKAARSYTVEVAEAQMRAACDESLRLTGRFTGRRSMRLWARRSAQYYWRQRWIARGIRPEVFR